MNYFENGLNLNQLAKSNDNELEIIDIDEFRELEIDERILENIANDNYNEIFRLETKSQNYVLEFKREHFILDSYIIFKAKSHIFIKDKFPIIENLLIYELDEDNKSRITLLEDEPAILDILGDIYEDELENDEEYDELDEDEIEENNLEYDNYSKNNENANYFDYDSLFEPTEDLYDKLFDDKYISPLVVKTHEGKTIIYKKIGKVEYKKNIYFIMQFLDKFLKKEKYDYIVYCYEKGDETSNLSTVYNKRLHKKILKIYSKKIKLN